MPRTRSEIVDKVTERARTLFEQGWQAKEITLPAFRELGRELGYKVAAKHCAADFSEWLYDLSWSDMRKADDGGSYFVGQPLVLETETKPDPHADGDFRSSCRPEPSSACGSPRSRTFRRMSASVRNKSGASKGRSRTIPTSS